MSLSKLDEIKTQLEPHHGCAAMQLKLACKTMREGVEILKKSNYGNPEGVFKIVDGFIIREHLNWRTVENVLYNDLGLDKERLQWLLETDEDHFHYSSCQLLQVLCLEEREVRARELIQIIERKGRDDPLWKDLWFLWCMVGGIMLEDCHELWEWEYGGDTRNMSKTTRGRVKDQAAKALAAFCIADFCYKRYYDTECALVTHLQAECMMFINRKDAMVHFENFLEISTSDNKRKHWAHFFLCLCYIAGKDLEKAAEQYEMGRKAVGELLPTFKAGWVKIQAWAVLQDAREEAREEARVEAAKDKMAADDNNKAADDKKAAEADKEAHEDKKRAKADKKPAEDEKMEEDGNN